MLAISCTILYKTMKESMNRISMAHKMSSILDADPSASQAMVIFALIRKPASNMRWMISMALRIRPGRVIRPR